MHFKSKIWSCVVLWCFFLITTALFCGCSTVKNFPANKPFVFDNKLIIEGKLTKEAHKKLLFELDNYWADSLKARKIQQFGFLYKLKNPPVFDTLNIGTTKSFMNAFLNAQGFYYANIKPWYKIDTVLVSSPLTKMRNVFRQSSKKLPVKHTEYRTTIAMKIDVGKTITIDTVTYAFSDTALLHLAMSQQQYSYLKKGNNYSKQLISSELDRLINIFHQNGYYRLQREDLYALIDTLDKQFLTFSTDPIKQLQLIAQAAKSRKENALWRISILQKANNDSLKSIKYHIGNLYYYPEYNGLYNPDSLIRYRFPKSFVYKEMVMKYHEGKFYYKPLREHTYLRRGNVYNEESLYKTVNTLSRIGSWSNVDFLLKPRNKDSLDIHFFMTPASKQSYTVSLEGSRNTGDIGSGNLLGIATNLAYTNRNKWKRTVQSLTNARLGTELNLDQQQSTTSNSFLQTIQASLGHSYNIPRLIHPFANWRTLNRFINRLNDKRTVIATSAAYTDRRTYYKLASLVTSWSYEFSSKGNHAFSIKPLNVELYRVDTLEGLINLFVENPFLRNAFRNGNVAGSSLNWSKTFNGAKNSNTSHMLRLGAEESGRFLGWFYSKAINKTFDYIKLEAEYRFVKKYKKDELATRLFMGVGLPKKGQTLPVFKQYFLGGPNSMRAWGLRQLGLGSSKYSDTSTSGYTDRFGDFMIETNIEYRFPIASFSAVKVGSAVYADIGNVWNIHDDPYNLQGSFVLRNLTKDLAIGIGTGLRFDFSYFLFRLDFAYKLKDPARTYNNGWMRIKHFDWTEKRENGVSVKNYAFQFGIGLPF